MAARSLAIASVVLGLISLPTAGGLGLGALAGLVAGVVALTRLRRSRTREGQRIAMAGILLSVLAAVLAVPLAGILLGLYQDGTLSPGALADAPPAGQDVTADTMAPPEAELEVEGGPEETGQEPVRSDPELREPRKVRHVPPVYPEPARRAGVEGTVVLECVIGVDGRVASATVKRSVPPLDAAALEAVRQWRYEPSTLRGRRVPIILTVTLNFRLQS